MENFVIGVLLLAGIGRFELGINADTLGFVIGIVMISSVFDVLLGVYAIPRKSNNFTIYDVFTN